MTAILCISASLLACTPAALDPGTAPPPPPGAPLAPARGGHARHEAWMERGGQAVVVLDPVGDVAAWTCIHNGTPVGGGSPYTVGQGEAAWNDSGDPYWGGLQMDRGFMATYGADMEAKYGGLADVWSPRDQMVVAERARASGRGYAPWPMTARACGLL